MIKIKPENPSSDDHVEFEFSVYGCGFQETPKKVHVSQYVFEADFVMVPCMFIAPPLPVAWSVDRLEAGDYQVILTQNNYETVVQSFSVSQGELPFPEPSIPTLGLIGAIVLVVALTWIANKAFQTDAQKRAA